MIIIVVAVILLVIFTWIKDYNYEHSSKKIQEDDRLVDDILNDRDY